MGHVRAEQGFLEPWTLGCPVTAESLFPFLPLLQGSGTQTTPTYRQFRIQKRGVSFVLEGWEREFSTVRELMDVLKGCTLKSGEESFAVRRCCPPKPGGTSPVPSPWGVRFSPGASGSSRGSAPAQSSHVQRARAESPKWLVSRLMGSLTSSSCGPLPTEISDLIIARKVKDSTRQILNLTQLSFHQIRKNEITQVGLPDKCSGGGSRETGRCPGGESMRKGS